MSERMRAQREIKDKLNKKRAIKFEKKERAKAREDEANEKAKKTAL